ncbi:MAG TPA: hypothetical protein VD932_04015 [Aquabacterium sp.]|nr:hypothetical protein [Aquabacterium sp.]
MARTVHITSQQAVQMGLLAPDAAKRSVSKEDIFATQCETHRLPQFVRQLRFAQRIGRQWQFDFAFPRFMLAAEVEGLVVRQLWDKPVGGKRVQVVYGRHATISGFLEDCVKYNTAAMLGWTVLRFGQQQVKSGEAIEMTMNVLAARGWQA